MRRRVATNLLWMLAERSLQVATGIGIVAMLARALGPEGFAHFQYAQAVVAIAASVALICGGEVVVPRLVGEASAPGRHRLISHALGLRLLGAALGYALMCGYLGLTDASREIWGIALLLGVAIFLREPAGVVIAWMQASTNNRPGAVFSLVSLSAKTLVVGGLAWTGVRTALPYASAFAIEAVLLATMLASYYRRRHGVPASRNGIDTALGRELLQAGMLFWISFMLTMGARRVDQLILQPAVSPAEFSAYAATMQILDNYGVAATILAAGIAPVYIYGKSRLEEAHRNVGRATVLLVAVGLAGAILLSSAADWIVQLVYGDAFAPAAALLRVAAFASVLVFADVGLTLLAVRMRKPAWVAGKWAATLAIIVAVDLYAVPRHGSWGALAGYAVGNGIAVVVGLGLWMRQRGKAVITPHPRMPDEDAAHDARHESP